MPRFLITLLLLTFAAPAQALELVVWDKAFQMKVGYGESSGSRLNVQLLPNYTGAVVVLFSQTDEERRRNTFGPLLSRYDGFLRAGQLTLKVPGEARSANADVNLSKLLSPYRLTVNAQSDGQNLSLPGLKVMPDNLKLNNK